MDVSLGTEAEQSEARIQVMTSQRDVDLTANKTVLDCVRLSWKRRLSCPVRRLNIHISACSRATPASGAFVSRPSPRAVTHVPRRQEYLTGYAREAWLELAPELHKLNLLTVLDLGPVPGDRPHSAPMRRISSIA